MRGWGRGLTWGVRGRAATQGEVSGCDFQFHCLLRLTGGGGSVTGFGKADWRAAPALTGEAGTGGGGWQSLESLESGGTEGMKAGGTRRAVVFREMGDGVEGGLEVDGGR